MLDEMEGAMQQAPQPARQLTRSMANWILNGTGRTVQEKEKIWARHGRKDLCRPRAAITA
jgi:hypothetical protein